MDCADLGRPSLMPFDMDSRDVVRSRRMVLRALSNPARNVIAGDGTSEGDQVAGAAEASFRSRRRSFRRINSAVSASEDTSSFEQAHSKRRLRAPGERLLHTSVPSLHQSSPCSCRVGWRS